MDFSLERLIIITPRSGGNLRRGDEQPMARRKPGRRTDRRCIRDGSSGCSADSPWSLRMRVDIKNDLMLCAVAVQTRREAAYRVMDFTDGMNGMIVEGLER